MRAIKVIWGLLVDDAWLAGGAVASILLLFVFVTKLHGTYYGGWALTACLVLSLALSLAMEVRRHRRKHG